MEKSFRRRFIYLFAAQLLVMTSLLVTAFAYSQAAWPFLSGSGVGAVSPDMTGFTWARWYQLMAAAAVALAVELGFALYLYRQYHRLAGKLLSGRPAYVSDYVAGGDLGQALRSRFVLLLAVFAVAIAMAFVVSWRYGLDTWPSAYQADPSMSGQVSGMFFRYYMTESLFVVTPLAVLVGNVTYVIKQYRMLRLKLQTGEAVQLEDYVKADGTMRTLV